MIIIELQSLKLDTLSFSVAESVNEPLCVCVSYINVLTDILIKMKFK